MLSWSNNMLHLPNAVSNAHVAVATAYHSTVAVGGRYTQERSAYNIHPPLSLLIICLATPLYITYLVFWNFSRLTFYFTLYFQCNSVLIFHSSGYGRSASLANMEELPLFKSCRNIYIRNIYSTTMIYSNSSCSQNIIRSNF